MNKMFIFSVAFSITLASSAFSAINDDLKKALKDHDCKIIEHTLAAGADITTIDAFGHNALHIATLENDVHLVADILSYYKQELDTFIDQQDYSLGSTALHFAYLVQSEQIIELLHNAHANKTIKDFYGLTPDAYWPDDKKADDQQLDNESDQNQTEDELDESKTEDELEPNPGPKELLLDW